MQKQIKLPVSLAYAGGVVKPSKMLDPDSDRHNSLAKFFLATIKRCVDEVNRLNLFMKLRYL